MDRAAGDRLGDAWSRTLQRQVALSENYPTRRGYLGGQHLDYACSRRGADVVLLVPYVVDDELFRLSSIDEGECQAPRTALRWRRGHAQLYYIQLPGAS